jgi:hypothetical protein
MKILKINEISEYRKNRKIERKSKAQEVKSMLDNIFIELVDKGAESSCKMYTIPVSTIGEMAYLYELNIEYSIAADSDISLSKASDVLSKISEHILDIEVYLKYLKGKYKSLRFNFNVGAENSQYSKCILGFVINVDKSDIEKN